MAKLADDDVLQLCDCLGIVVMNVFIEGAPKEEMLISNWVRAERTRACFFQLARKETETETTPQQLCQ